MTRKRRRITTFTGITGRMREGICRAIRLGWGGGNVYGHVDNNALIHTDPIGLIGWDGVYVIWSAGISRLGAGLSVYTADFTLNTKCVNRKKGFATVKVFGLQGGAVLVY